MKAVEHQKTWDQWNRDGGQYIPNPSTWLNQHRWEDEPVHVFGQPKKNNFNNFSQREYTEEQWKELEEDLFGLKG